VKEVRLDPYSLELFVETVREGSIARAAARHHIAASALSRRIADLEITFGVSLLIRSPKGVRATDAGRHVFDRATRLQDELRALVSEVHSLEGRVSGVVKLFANASSIVGFLPERLKRFQAMYPLVDIELHEYLSDEVFRACLDERADVGVCATRPFLPEVLDHWPFAEDPLIVVLPIGHALACEATLTLAQVVKFPLVALQAGGSLDQTLRERTAALSVPLRVAVTVNSFDAQCRMVEAGLGIGIVPKSAASAYAGASRFVRVMLDEPWGNRQLGVYAMSMSPRLNAVQALIDAIKAPGEQCEGN
jgi:DNA-binding transcriptional LysR family regulator